MSVRLLDFEADWCGPCESQKSILETVVEAHPSVSLETIDVDDDRETANEYHVRSLPTVVVEKDGEIVDRFVGVTQQADLEAALAEAGA